jgi:uncharacterized repeat protein (TIGR01451 family)
VVANTSARSGGNLMSNGTTSIADSILSGGQALNGPDCSSFGGATIPAVSGKNIVGVTSGGCTFPGGTVVANAPQLGALGDHGAPGKTAVPAAGSPALDAASACPDGGRDQRGAPAPSGAACDIGAAEASADLQVSVQASAASAAPGEQVSFVVKATNAGPDPAESTSIAITPPSGAEVLLVSPSTGSCDQTTCSVGSLAAGSSATVTVVVRPSSAGTATTSATATSPVPDPTSGDATGSASTIVAAAGGGGGGGGGGTTTPDTTAPVLGAFAAKGKLRSGRRGRLRAVLSEAASVRIVVARTRGKRRRVGVIVARLAAGEGVIVVPRKLKGKRLKPGLYRLTAVATDAAGNKSAPKRITVRVRAAG